MKAVVFRGIGDIRLEDVPDPKIEKPTDAIVRLTASAICGTDLHFIRGTIGPMKSGTILGHEGVGVVEEVGSMVRNLVPGDRVIIPSTIACGACSYCRAGYYAQCDGANPHGKRAGTAFFGGPEESGSFQGLQAERARIPFAHVGLVKIPDEVTDDQAILLSDIFPTGWFGAELAEVGDGDTVAVFGCGPVGQFAIASAKLMGAGRIFAVDSKPDRLEMARRQGAEVVNFGKENPVATILDLTGGIGADRAIDAVGVDAEAPHDHGNVQTAGDQAAAVRSDVKSTASPSKPGGQWHPGDAPGQALGWAVEALAKAGTLGVIGVYVGDNFPIGNAMEKNLTIKAGNCNHRKYLPHLVALVRARVIDPTAILTNVEPLSNVIEAYEAFDRREPGWLKIKLDPAA